MNTQIQVQAQLQPTIQQRKMPKMNYRMTQDAEVRTSESESEEERVDIRNVPAEHHKSKKRVYRSRSRSIEYPDRRKSPSEDRPRGVPHGTNMRRERSGYRPRDESLPVHKVPKYKVPPYQGWSNDKPVSKRKCREHTVYQTQPDNERVMEKKERKVITSRPATTPGTSAAPVPTTPAAQPGQTPTAQRAATQPPSLGIQPTTTAQINQPTGMQVDQEFFFKTLQHIERIVKAGQSKRNIKPEAIEIDLTRVKEEKPELVTIPEDHGDDCEDREIKAETGLEGGAIKVTEQQRVIEEQGLEVEKPTNTRKRINKMVKIMKIDDLKETK